MKDQKRTKRQTPKRKPTAKSGEPASNKPEDLDALWQSIREGDTLAARRLIERLIAEGDDERVEVAVSAIGRRFERVAQQLLRQAQVAGVESRKRLTAEAIYAFTTAAVAKHLPTFLQTSLSGENMRYMTAGGASLQGPLPPPTNLRAEGIDGGIKLTWIPSQTTLPVRGQVVSVFSDLQRIKESEMLGGRAVTYEVTGLVDEKSYLCEVKTVADLLTNSATITAVAGKLQSTLPAPSNVQAVGKDHGIMFSWDRPVPTAGSNITDYLLELTGDGLMRKAEVQAPIVGERPSYLFTDLQNGLPYTLTIQSIGTVDGAEKLGEISEPVTAIAGLNLSPFVPRMPYLPADPLLFLDRNLIGEIQESERRLVEANAIAQKWRFEYLKERATQAANDALSYDRQIMELISLTLSKASAAETQLTPVILAAIGDLQADAQKLANVAGAETVMEAIGKLGDATASAMILAAVLEWLARSDAFDIWIGLFDAMLGDMAASSTSFPRVKEFIDKQYENGVFGNAIKRLAAIELDRAQAEVSNMIQPLREAIGEIIGATSGAMAEVFKSFDLPLLMRPSVDFDIPNVNPLITDLENLQKAVTELENNIASQIKRVLLDIVEGKAKELFRDIMIAYFVTPLAAALAVAIAGGPVSAVLAAATFAIAAEELLHLVARFLSGPLSDQLGVLNKKVGKALVNLQRAISNQVPLGLLTRPESKLWLLRDELRQLQTLLPQAFLEDLADLLADARDLTLESGILHALAAERALGFDNATAFDRILNSYKSRLTPAAQMPGGRDAGLFAGARLLRDLKLLERDMIRLTDGKEITLTRRLSLFHLLGGIGDPMTAADMALGQFRDFLLTGRASIELRPEMLVDSLTPGAYRALIKDIRVFAISKAPIANNLSSSTGLSVTLTHSGRSSTRIKRTSNPSSPPIDLPLGFPDEEAFVLAQADYNESAVDVPPAIAPNSILAKIWSVVADMPGGTAGWDYARKKCLKELPSAIAELGSIRYVSLKQATGSASLPDHGPENAIDGDRRTYYSSVNQSSSRSEAWLVVELSQASEVITGVRLWPREMYKGFPETFKLQVSETGALDDYRDIPKYKITRLQTPGQEAYYMHFAPVAGRFIRILATTLTQGDYEGKYNFQLSDIQIEVMNVTIVPHSFVKAVGSAALYGHPASCLIKQGCDTYYSSVGFNVPNPPSDAAPWFKVTLPSASVVNRIKLYPRLNRLMAFPKDFKMTLEGNKSFFYSFSEYSMRGKGKQVFDLPSYPLNSIKFVADTLPLVDPYYALQFDRIEAEGFSWNSGLIQTAPIQEAVETILRGMVWPASPLIADPLNAASKIMCPLVQGLSERSIPGLADKVGTGGVILQPGVARAAWQAGYSQWLRRIAKWDGARQEAEPDPNVRGLDYVRLVQNTEPQAVTFELFPKDDGVTRAGVLLLPHADSNGANTDRYRPFENLGIEGLTQIEVPEVAKAMLADLFIEIDMRCCFDTKLAATLRAGQEQRNQQIERVVDIGTNIAMPRALTVGGPTIRTGTSGLQTVQFSLRTQRDRILQAALAGAQITQGTNEPTGVSKIDGIKFRADSVSPLGLSSAFSFFSLRNETLGSTISLVFTRDANRTLRDQLTNIVITPDVLGIDPSLLVSALPLAEENKIPALEGLAIVLIPTRVGALNFAPKVGDVDEKLKPLLDSTWSTNGNTIKSLLTITSPAQARSKAVSLADLWPSSGWRRLQVDFAMEGGGDQITSGYLYDVIFSVSFRAPLLTGVTTAPGLF